MAGGAVTGKAFEPESERVTRKLRGEIIDRVRAPGSRLIERELADELHVSRVPVRDALRALVAEGLVISRPRSWAVVREFTAGDIADLNEVRAAVEPLVFTLAAARRTREGLQQLRSIATDELAAAETGDATRARHAAADFHEAVTGLAANDLLVEMLRPLRSRIRWVLSQHDDLLAVAQEHRELYDAIADRDVARVRQLIDAHLRRRPRPVA